MTVLGVPRRTLGVWFTETEIAFAIVEADGHEVMRGRVPRSPRGRSALVDALPPNVVLAIISEWSQDPLYEAARVGGTSRQYIPLDLVYTLLEVKAPDARPESIAAMVARLPGSRL